MKATRRGGYILLAFGAALALFGFGWALTGRERWRDGAVMAMTGTVLALFGWQVIGENRGE